MIIVFIGLLACTPGIRTVDAPQVVLWIEAEDHAAQGGAIVDSDWGFPADGWRRGKAVLPGVSWGPHEIEVRYEVAGGKANLAGVSPHRKATATSASERRGVGHSEARSLRDQSR